MLKIVKVTGESLSPFFQEGDFVLVLKAPWLIKRLKQGDILVFRHPTYGTLIKRIKSLGLKNEEFFVIGEHPDSLDSRQFGAVPKSAVIGKVIWHIKKPRNYH